METKAKSARPLTPSMGSSNTKRIGPTRAGMSVTFMGKGGIQARVQGHAIKLRKNVKFSKPQKSSFGVCFCISSTTTMVSSDHDLQNKTE